MWSLQPAWDGWWTLLLHGQAVATARIQTLGFLKVESKPLVNWSALGDMSPEDTLSFCEGLTALAQKIRDEFERGKTHGSNG